MFKTWEGDDVKQTVALLMLGNAALFLLGALQHAGVAIGPLHEPVIIPASIVELLCALALIWGTAAVLIRSHSAWRAVLIGNLVAITGVTVGIVALAAGAGPRTASNELYHRIMLALAAASLIIIFLPNGREMLHRRNRGYFHAE